jgi:hypothetical protein
MATIVERQLMNQYYPRDFDGSGRSSVSSEAGYGLVSINGLAISTKTRGMNVIGRLDTMTRRAYILDDLDVSNMSNDEQAVVRQMLIQLGASARVSSTLALDIPAFVDYALPVAANQAAS